MLVDWSEMLVGWTGRNLGWTGRKCCLDWSEIMFGWGRKCGLEMLVGLVGNVGCSIARTFI